MPLACVYHKSQPMRVVTPDEREQMVATGEWFKHPSCKQEESKHEEPIRRKSRKGKHDSECPPEKTGSGALC